MSLVIFIVVLLVAFSLVNWLLRPAAQPTEAGERIHHQGVNPNPELNVFNSSPLATFQRWQSGIAYKEFRTHNQNNPSGVK